ncbi:MAG: Amuc_1098 family type IV pilus outer membrane protein [Verrucomicrobiales bacterium]
MLAPIGLVGLAGLAVSIPVADAQSGLPDIAQREIARRQERVAEANEAILEAERLLAEKDYEAAIGSYRSALDLLPDAPMTGNLEAQITKKYADASVELARQRAEEGRYDEAISLVEAVLAPSVAPDHRGGLKLLGRLNDPDYYSPALSPEHVARVQQVEQALKVAMGYHNLGDFDSAEAEYFRVLNIDRYNTAARRGLEDNERVKARYYESAYDETRARFMTQLTAEWETKVPEIGLEDILKDERSSVMGGDSGVAYISAKLKEILIPNIEFSDTPLEDAIEFLRQKSVELDTLESDPRRKGVNIIIQDVSSGGGGDLSGEFAPEGAEAPAFAGGASPRITLSLSNVPLVEALRYVTELAGRKYKIDPYAVKIVALSDVGEDLFTKVFRVPPTFLSLSGGGGGGGAPEDPFADPADGDGGSVLAARPTATAVLEEKGISFPPGSSAFFNPATSQLVVRNTAGNMELIETFVESLVEDVQKQIHIMSKFVEIGQENLNELGFDWLLGFFNIPGSSRVFGGGGTLGNTRDELAVSDYAFSEPGSASPFGANPVTSANRSGSNAVTTNSIDGLINPAAAGLSSLAPGVLSLAGVFTDPEFQLVIRAINQKKGVDLLSAPNVTARSGQRAKIEVVREFIYPTEYDPPEIPTNVGGGSGDGVTTIPVTPANPTAFETRNTGVTLEVDPVIGADGFTIDLNLVPEVVEFDGFINYGTPILKGELDNFGRPIVLTDNIINMPVFSTRKVTTAVTIWDGQTVVIGGLIREDVQSTEDKVPLLGDIPFVGRLFRSKADFRIKRNLTIFVTAKLIDPAGAPIRKFDGAGSAETAAIGAGGLGGAGGDTISASPLLPTP